LFEINEVKLKWEKKTNKKSSSKSLIKLIEDLQTIEDDNFLDFINKNFNYSKLIDFLAINAFIANGSTYYHNYYLYRDFNNG
jgi:spore coat protein CotH